MKWYITTYRKYPIYEPAEGGHYYEGIEVLDCQEFSNRKKAMRTLKKKRKEDEAMRVALCYYERWFCSDDGTCYGVNGRYIGQGWYTQLERGVSGRDKRGWVPYC